MQQPAWRAEFRSLNRTPRRILHAVQKYAVLARGGGGGPGGAALDLDSEKEPLGPWRDSDVRVRFFLSFPLRDCKFGPRVAFSHAQARVRTATSPEATTISARTTRDSMQSSMNSGLSYKDVAMAGAVLSAAVAAATAGAPKRVLDKMDAAPAIDSTIACYKIHSL